MYEVLAEDGSLELKQVAKLCIIDYILTLCLTEYIILWTLYDATRWLLSKQSNPAQSSKFTRIPKMKFPVEVIVLLGDLRRLFLN